MTSAPPFRRVKIDGFDLAYLEAGAGEPLVFIHGALCDARYWTPQIAAFAATHRVLAPSLRHCWPDAWDEGDDYTASRHVSDIIAFIAALGAGPVHLVGHSRGGRLALHVAARVPALARSLALYQPGGAWDATFLPVTAPASPNADSPVARIAAGDVESGAAMFLDALMGGGFWSRAPDSLRTMLRDNARTLIAMGRDSSEPMTRAMAEAIEAPALLIGGDGIPPVFLSVLDALEVFLRDSRRARLASSSHFANLEQPATFNAALAGFLASVGRG